MLVAALVSATMLQLGVHGRTHCYSVAKHDIPEDTALFTIPRDLIINVQTSKLVEKLPEVFDDHINDEDEEDDVENMDSWGSLILVMLYEYLQGESSLWRPYLDILPQTFDTPIFWSEAELKELEGTSLTTEKIGKNESDSMLRSRILPIITKHREVFYPHGTPQLNEEELLALAHRMGSTIMAYAFDLENEGEHSEDEEDGWVEDREGKTLMGMVPMADMLNANAEFNVRISMVLSCTALTTLIPRLTFIMVTIFKSLRFARVSLPGPKY